MSSDVEHNQPPGVLIVADAGKIRQALARILAQQGYRVLVTGSVKEAVSTVGVQEIAVALIDLQLQDPPHGHEVLEHILARSPDTQCVVLTAQADAKNAFAALNNGAFDYFEIPVEDWNRFSLVLRKAVEHRRIEEERERLKQYQRRIASRTSAGLEQIIGKSEAIQSVRERIRKVASTRAPVLIFGDSGTGKELVAKALHQCSPWHDRPFMDINCAAIPGNLLESELFGYEAGAFTGARQRRLGLFEVAEDGTIFLDEVGELPLDLQAKLLRVLETNQFRRVGGARNIQLRARVVSATNRVLRAMVEERLFRQDLLYRLEVVDIRVPSLRERREDIPLLTWYFVVKFNEQYGKQVRRIPKNVMQYLASRDWLDNNVRELHHVVHRAMVLADGESLTFDLLGARPGANLPGLTRMAVDEEDAANLPDELMALSYKEFKNRLVQRFSRAYLQRRLRESGGNIAEAARRSGQERTNFKKLMKKFDVSADFARP